MEVIKNKRILALVGIGCLLVGTFLPYFTISIFGFSQSLSLWGYWEGKVILVLTLSNALFIFSDWIKKYVPQLFNNNIGKIVDKVNNPKFALVPTILVAAFAIYMFVNIEVDSEYIKYGIGFWILWLGIISLIGHSIFYKKQNAPFTQVQQFGQSTVSYMQQPAQPTVGYGQSPMMNNQQPVSQPQPMYNGQVQQPGQPTMNIPNNNGNNNL